MLASGNKKLSISEKVSAVEKVFEGLSRDIAKFQQHSGLQCLIGCGKCCHKSDIEASTIEFLPFAYYLYKQNKSEEWLDRIDQEAPVSACLLLTPFLQENKGGFCSQYIYRGLICRLFGFSASRDKYGAAKLVTCKPIKTEMPEIYDTAVKGIEDGVPVPVMNHYYMQLYAIDISLAKDLYPINEAIRRAIEIVATYYYYSDQKPA